MPPTAATCELQLRHLDFVLTNPRLYLADFFDNLTNEIDTESQKFLISQQNNHSINTCEILSNHQAIIDAVRAYQTVCFEALSSPESLTCESTKNQLAYIKRLIEQRSFRLADERIYECLVNIQARLFCNKAIFFLSSETAVVDVKNTFGVLLFVEDEFIGPREAALIR